MKLKNKLKKLQSRVKDYEDMISKHKVTNPNAYHKPGSMK